VRLQPDLWHQTVKGATLRAIADRDADERGLTVSDGALLDAALRFRRQRGLHDTSELVAWLSDNGLDGKEFIELMENETRLQWLIGAYQDEAMARVPDELRANGRLAAVHRRAQDKARWIEAQGLGTVSIVDLGLREGDIFAWYFGRSDGETPPADLWAYAQAVGFADVEQFRRAVIREYLFATREPSADAE
jgi:hypothetical protein